MPSRRKVLLGAAAVVAVVAAGAGAVLLGRDRKPVVRPAGVPLSPYSATSTALDVTTGRRVQYRPAFNPVLAY